MSELRNSAEIHANIIEMVNRGNELIKQNKTAEVAAMIEQINNDISAYNEAKKKETFTEWRASDTAIEIAIRNLEIPILRLAKEMDDEKAIVSIETENDCVYFDLLEFDRFCTGKDVFANPGWKHMVEKVHYLLALRVAHEIGDDPAVIAKKFKISKKSSKFAITADEVSNTMLKKTLQKILDAIIFVPRNDGENKYRVENPDMKWLLMTLTTAGKTAHGLNYSSPKTMRILLLRTLNRVITNGKYNLEYISETNGNKVADEVVTGLVKSIKEAETKTQNEGRTGRTSKTKNAETKMEGEEKVE